MSDKRLRERDRKRDEHAAGQCVSCPRPTKVNPVTGKLFWRCLPCRRREAARYHAWRAAETMQETQ